MFKYYYIGLLVLIMLLPTGLYAADIGNCDDLVKNMRQCQKYGCTIPPDKPGGFIKRYQVAGKVPKKGHCVIMESMKGGQAFMCIYNDQTLDAAANMIEDSFAGATEINKDDQALMLDAWNDGLCTILKG